MCADTDNHPPLALTVSSPHLAFIVCLLLAAVVFFSNLWIGDLGLDSAAYATISRAMLRTGDWIVPHYEHCPEYVDCWLHPPLFYWLTASSFRVFGINEFAARFPAAILGLGTVLIAYLIGLFAGGSRKCGFFSGLVLLTTQAFLELGRKCQIDVPLAFFISLSVLFFILGRGEKGCWWFDALAGAACGLALLTKGVPALALIGLFVAYAALTRDWKFFLPQRFGAFLLGAAAVLTVWIVPLARTGKLDAFLHGYFVDQIWGNFSGTVGGSSSSWSNRLGGYLWYLGALAKRYWPWFPFLLVAAVMAVRGRKTRRLPVLFLLWVLIIIVGFSAGGTKYYRYLAPAYPGAAVLIGVVLGGKASEKLFRGFLAGTAIFALVLLLATSLAPFYFGKINAPDKSDIKAMAPAIRAWTAESRPVATLGLGYWSTVADFAFYVDRPIRNFNDPAAFAEYVRGDLSFGYLLEDAYRTLREDFRNTLVPVARSGRFLLITNRAEFEKLVPKIFPILLH
jgi:4-amino-4-deoxy-L-arabinose transferase-like glycosyltransferase